MYTIEDIYALPEGERAELIDGQIYYMAPPSRTHQKLSMFFSSEISNYIKEKKGICEVYSAPFAVFLNKDETNYVEPDISVICDTDKLDEQGCHGAPDWIIEIVSPSNKSMDYLTKLFKYRAAGVREYWIVDPIKLMIIVYTFGKESMEEYSFGDKVPAGIFDDFTIKVE
ncbi:MAG: Uma2 family endonuclease [Eubacterium sp.]|nr:Uma2 family endonuclease [Eubacterium sp.]MCI8917869.1 Uma2 family endonuclease [Eubacterium sp.]